MAGVSKQRANEVIQKFNVELLEQLPLDNTIFLGKLYQANLIPPGEDGVIQQKPTRSDKVSYYLRNVVQPGADLFLPELLKVMKLSGNLSVIKLAEDIDKALLESGNYR